MTTRLGPYELLREVGYGGMGSVFLGRRVGLGGFHKWVAIKTIHPHLSKQPAFVTMFLDEARTAASMHHPNVTTVFDVGEADGTYFLAMEYLHGEHLGALHGTGPIDPFLAAYAVARAAEGLHHAHEITDERGVPRGLVHRDVSPHNIFLTYDGHVKVTDFGIARAEGRLAQTTETGRIKGKCAYMAPEQVQAHPLDRRADLFALGVVLWELSTGERLYVAPTDAQVLLAILREEPRLPSLLVRDYPRPLQAIVMKCLARDPDDRFASGAELARALDAFVATASRPIGAAELAELMRERFGAEREDKDLFLRGMSSRSASSTASTLATDAPTVEAPSADPIRVDRVRVDSNRTSSGDDARPRRTRSGRRRMVLWGGLGVLALVGVAVGVALGGSGEVRDGGEGSEVGASTPAQPDRPGSSSVSSASSTPEASEGARQEPPGSATAVGVPTRTGDPAPDDSEMPRGVALEADEVEPASSGRDTAVRPIVRRNERTNRTPTTPTEPHAMTTTPAAVGRATLSLLTEPWATVRIDGRDFGRTPLFAREVPAGRLRIELRARGEGDLVTRTVDAPAGESVSLRVTLPD